MGRPKGSKDTKPRKPRSDKGKPRKKKLKQKKAAQKTAKKVVLKAKTKDGITKPIPVDIAQEAANADMSPIEYMLKVMRDDGADKDRRDRMAIAAAPYVHKKATEKTGKKTERGKRAKAAAKGRFAPTAAPKLASVNGKAVS